MSSLSPSPAHRPTLACANVCPEHGDLVVPYDTCWYCLHAIKFSPNWRFVERMTPLLLDDAPPPPVFDDAPFRPRWLFVNTDIPLRAHVQCHYLNQEALVIPESVDEAEFLWSLDDEAAP